jgi:hypothetical protein
MTEFRTKFGDDWSSREKTYTNKHIGLFCAQQDSFGNVLRGFLINRYETKFIYPHNLYSMTSRLEDMKIARQNEVK